MKWSQTFLFTLKEAPQDAEIPSHKLMIRAGLIKKLGPGLYSYGSIFLRALRKFEAIIRQELNARGCIEILMPLVQPKELWDESQRWGQMGDGLLKFKNRNEQWYCLGPTHEEVVTDYVRHDIKSYRHLPKNIYQIQTKYRDEIRPRFGLMRGREFIMKDAYSFDLDKESALKTYQTMYDAYKSIFSQLGVDYRIVQADAGNIGGSHTHEFQLLAEAGEDALLVGEQSEFAANVEVCPAIDAQEFTSQEAHKPVEKFATPNQRTIADLAQFTGLKESELVKTLFFNANDGSDIKNKSFKPIAVLLRGSDELNPIKLKNLLGLVNPLPMLTDEEIKNLTSAAPGSCGPVGLSIPIYADRGLSGMKNYIVGANQDGFHLRNVNHERDFKLTSVADLRMAKAGDRCPSGKGFLKAYRGIEVGHVFYLGQLYAKKLNATYLDRNGKSQVIEMGCYGIGVTRTIQACIEQSHDQDGIIWPKSISPFHVHLCNLDPSDNSVDDFCKRLNQELVAKGIEVFEDDRDERPGVKFKDADLLGFPVRVVVGKKGLENNTIEVVNRKSKAVEKVAVSSAADKVCEVLKNL
jgi:prolyl-tRNA synthetase